jgi:hypothetical protein
MSAALKGFLLEPPLGMQLGMSIGCAARQYGPLAEFGFRSRCLLSEVRGKEVARTTI